MMQRIKSYLPVDTFVFLLQFFRHPQKIGSILPSSASLAQAMTCFVEGASGQVGPKRYLEVGAGTGAFTHAIIEKLGPKDTLDLVEINPKFCERLEKNLRIYDNDNITIHAKSILDWSPPYSYDVIVSSLPFNAFPSEFVSRIYAHYHQIIRPDGVVSYCEYIALPGIKKLFIGSSSRRQFQDTLDITHNFEGQYQVQEDKVLANFPPAYVHHCRLPG